VLTGRRPEVSPKTTSGRWSFADLYNTQSSTRSTRRRQEIAFYTSLRLRCAFHHIDCGTTPLTQINRPGGG